MTACFQWKVEFQLSRLSLAFRKGKRRSPFVFRSPPSNPEDSLPPFHLLNSSRVISVVRTTLTFQFPVEIGGAGLQPPRNLGGERFFHQNKREQSLSDAKNIRILDRPNFHWNGAIQRSLLNKRNALISPFTDFHWKPHI